MRAALLALAAALALALTIYSRPLTGQARSRAFETARVALASSVETARKWMTPSPKAAHAASVPLPMPEPVATPKNAGDGITNDGITNASGAACTNVAEGLWEAAAAEQKGVFTSTFASRLHVGSGANESTFLTDVNNDGYPDIVYVLDGAAGANAGTYVWLNKADGSGQFNVTAIVETTYGSSLASGKVDAGSSTQSGLRGESTFVGDVDNDGIKDLVYVYRADAASGTHVWKGNGTGTFSAEPIEKVTYTNSLTSGGILAGADTHVSTFLVDTNNDGNLDILFLADGDSGPRTFIWLGDGTGRFADDAIENVNYTSTLSPPILDVGTSTNESTFVADVTGDGNVDIVYVYDGGASGTNAGTYVWAGIGDGTFWPTAIEKKTYTSTLPSEMIEAGTSANEGTHLVDVNNDGKLDLLYVTDANGDPNNSGTFLWLGNGDGTFATAAQEKKQNGGFYSHTTDETTNSWIETGRGANEISRVADVDQDGRLDIVWMLDDPYIWDAGVFVWKGRCVSTNATLSIALNPTSISAGQESTLTYTLTGPNVNGIAFTNSLPSGLVVASPNGVTNNCGTGTVTADPASSSVSISGVNVGASSCTISVKVKATTAGTKRINQFSFSGTTNVTVTNAFAQMGVVPNPTLSKAFSPTAIALNSQVTQTSTVTFTINNAALIPDDVDSAAQGNSLESTSGSTAARMVTRRTSRSVRGSGERASRTSVEVSLVFAYPPQSGIAFTETLPAGLVLAAAPTASQCGGTVSGSLNGNTITLSGGSLANGQPNCQITATVKPMSLGTKTNTAANISGTANLNASGVNASLTVYNTAAGANSCYTDKGVMVCYNTVSAPFNTTITPIDPNSAGPAPVGFTFTPPNVAFDITASDPTKFTAPITITFAGVPINDAAMFATLRVFHGEKVGESGPLTLVDRTVLPPNSPAPDFASRSISARVNSLSPFAIGMLTGLPVAVSDQKAGSVLVFPYYTSASDGSFSKSDTLLTISNVCNGAATQANGAPNYQFLHLFFMNGANCSPADTFVCLTPNGSIQIRASDYDPMLTGYMIAVAVDASGAPTENNCFIGSAFVRDDANGVIDSYGAEAFWKLTPGAAPISGGNATIALNGMDYDAAPVQLATQVQDPAVADELIVLASVSGDLGTATVAATQSGVGVLYRADEMPASFQPQIGTGCFSLTAVDKSKIRVVPGTLETFLKDSYGYLKFQVSAPAVGLLISRQGPANQATNRWSGIRTLHKTAVGSATLVAPCFPPFCGF